MKLISVILMEEVFLDIMESRRNYTNWVDKRKHPTKDGGSISIEKTDTGMYRAKSKTGKVVGALIVATHDKPKHVFNVEVKDEWKRKGVATHLYDRAEEDHGPLAPSTAQSNEAFAFWKKRRPEAYDTKDLRFKRDDLLGKEVDHPQYGRGKITGVSTNSVLVQKDSGATFGANRKILKGHGLVTEGLIQKITGHYGAVNIKHGAVIGIRVKDNVFSAYLPNGKEVGVLKIAKTKNGDISALYLAAEKHTGRKMIPSTVQTADAKAFWNSKAQGGKPEFKIHVIGNDQVQVSPNKLDTPPLIKVTPNA